MTDNVRQLLQQAAALHQEGRLGEAIAVYRRLLSLRPDLADSWYDLAFLLKSTGDYDGALKAYETALSHNVAGPEEVYLNRAVIYADHLRRDEKAEEELKKAIAANPSYAPALLNLGNLYEEKGARDEAAACYEKIVAAPTAEENSAARHEAMARLIHLRPPGGVDDPALQDLQRAATAETGLDPMTRSNMFFALGRSYDALGAYDEAFDAFAQANKYARRTGAPYNREAMERQVDALIDAFPEAASTPPRPGETPAPIFICGMFRSGSTLAEQVLAAHPDVIPGGELNILHKLAGGALTPFPSSLKTTPGEKLRDIADQYVNEIHRLFPDAARNGRHVTDKRPDNFLLIGLIKRLFPDARIVHTVRAPLDNAISIYFQHLAQTPAPYSSDLEDIAHYYGQYRRLMAHWETLHPDSIHRFDYDRFVQAPKPALEALLAFLGLEWSEACLAHHRVKNTVKTASYWQVRQPLYTKSSGRAQNYDRRLGALKEAFAAAGVDVDD